MDFFIKLAMFILCIIVIVLAEQATKYLRANLSAQDAEKLDKLIETLVAAADQLYKVDDEDGSVRLNYVQGMLIEAGYDLTETVLAIVESKVHALNIKQKQVKG